MLRIRELRLKAKLSVPELSELSGVHRRTIQDVEKRGDCTVSTAFKLAKALGVNLNDVYDENDRNETLTQPQT